MNTFLRGLILVLALLSTLQLIGQVVIFQWKAAVIWGIYTLFTIVLFRLFKPDSYENTETQTPSSMD